MMPPYQAVGACKVKFPEGLTVNGTYSFCYPDLQKKAGCKEFYVHKGEPKGELQIKKEMTDERTYKLAISYLGVDEHDYPLWKVEIHKGELLGKDKSQVYWTNCKAIEFKPYGNNSIEINATDHKDRVQTLWVNISKHSNKQYVVRRSPEGIDD